MDWNLIETTVNGVWGESTDAELRDATPEEFYKAVKGCGLTTEEEEEACGLFFERLQRVFGIGV
jgi:hypothetical protein